jgi:hypothetical protein
MLTDHQIKTMLRKARKRAKSEGKSLDDILLDIAYGDQELKVAVRDRLAAIRLFKELTMVKTLEQNINMSKQVGPVIGLPPIREDPALKILGGEKEFKVRDSRKINP